MDKNPTKRKKLTVNYTEYESLSYAIMDSLATIKETEITELEPLFNSVDLEAIDRLFEANSKDTLSVEQIIDGYTITIRGDGELTISKNNISLYDMDEKIL